MAQRGLISSFSAMDGVGDIRLEDGTVVRFGASALRDFRAVLPAPGLAVIVDDTQPGVLGKLRATAVRLDGDSWDETWHVSGLERERLLEREFPPRRVRLVPLEDRVLRDAAVLVRQERVARFARGPGAGPVEVKSHPALAGVAEAMRAAARKVEVLKGAAGKPARGSSFVGGAFADLGDTPWPAGAHGPAWHLLQLDARDTSSLGLDGQVNVFLAPTAPPATPALSAVGGDWVAAQVPRAGFVVVVSAGGPRRPAPRGLESEVVALAPARAAVAFPPFTFFSGAPEHAAAIAAFHRVRVVEPGLPLADASLSALEPFFTEAFPSADELGGELVLGGIASPHPGSEAPRARLLSLALEAFPQLATPLELHEPGFTQRWRRLTLDWSLDAEPQAWGAGT